MWAANSLRRVHRPVAITTTINRQCCSAPYAASIQKGILSCLLYCSISDRVNPLSGGGFGSVCYKFVSVDLLPVRRKELVGRSGAALVCRETSSRKKKEPLSGGSFSIELRAQVMLILTGSTSQISSAYWPMVRSLENFPQRAMLRRAMVAQWSFFVNALATFRWHLT